MECALIEAKEVLSKWKGQSSKKPSQSWGERMVSANESWEASRSRITEILLKQRYGVFESECCHCRKAPAIIKCEECGSKKHLCASCDVTVHHSHPLHDRLGIIDGHYQAIPPTVAFSTSCDKLIDIGMTCIYKFLVLLTLFNVITISIHYCGC